MASLDRLLGLIDYRQHSDQLWLVGDLVNRGPRSLDVLREGVRRIAVDLLELARKLGFEIVSVGLKRGDEIAPAIEDRVAA